MNEVFYTIKSYFGFLLFIVDELLFQKASNKGESVLFIHTAGLGDLVHSTKIINTLSKSEFKIYFLVKSTHLKFYDEYNGNVRILGVNYSKYRRNLLYRYFFLKKLRENKFRYSFILNHHRLITDDDIALHCGAEKKVALNQHDTRYIKFGRSYIDSRYDHVIITYNTYVEKKYDILLSDYFPSSQIKPSSLYFKNSEGEKSSDDNLSEDIITCQPYSLSSIRNWQKEKYIELFDYLLKTSSFKILLLGEAVQRNTLQPLVIDTERIINLAGQLSLKEVNQLLLKSKLFIGIDSSIAHFAEINNVKRIILVGGGSYDINYPQNVFTDNDENGRYIFYKMDCFGCNWICHQKLPYCITNVTTQQVIENIKTISQKQIN